MSAEDMAYELLMTYHVSPDEAMELMWDSSVVFVDPVIRPMTLSRMKVISGRARTKEAITTPAEMAICSH